MNDGINGNDVEFVARFEVLSPFSVGGLGGVQTAVMIDGPRAEIGTGLWRRWCRRS